MVRELLKVAIHAENRLHCQSGLAGHRTQEQIVEEYNRISQPIAYFLLSPSVFIYPTHTLFTRAHELINDKRRR